MRTRTKLLAILAFIFCLTPLVRADVQWPAKLGDWTASGEATAVGSFSSDPAFVPVVTESGFTSGVSHTYRSGNQTAQFTLYTFRDSSGAFEAYTAMKALDGPPKSTSTFLAHGNQVLWIRGNASLPKEFTDAAAKWEESISDGVASPPIASYLPTHGLESSTDLYALGPAAFKQALVGTDQALATTDLASVAGFNSHAEAMFGKYKSGRDEATLLLIDYPTPQLAELHLRHLQRALADAKLTTSSIERKGSLLSIVLSPTSPEYAAKLRGSVNYETQVMWNEASQAATDPPILSTVAKIFIATGVFMVVTVVIGIAFGGVRIITKRLFPGKVFDRKDQIEVLQLGLSGKPIDPSDMY
jgi:uncharacterized protein DUF6599